jgi:hypothetical protein
MFARRTRALLVATAVVTITSAWVGCGSDEEAAGGQPGGTAAGAPGGNGGDGGAGGSGAFTTSNGGSGNEGGACAQSSADATLQSRPVDIIVVIDNSGSMTEEIIEVEEQINANFAAIIDGAMPPIDYRVILLAGFGDSGDQQICVSAPLGGIADADMDGHCDNLPNQPVNTPKFFHHSVDIASHDALCHLIEQFTTADAYNLQPNGYQDVLRPEAFKFIAVITDDRPDCSFGGNAYDDNNSVMGGDAMAAAFDADLLALSPTHFGVDPTTRNYSFWSIIALAPYLPTMAAPYGDPHPPDAMMAPIITQECTPSAVNPGTGYQALSILSGGYRYPTCGLDYTAISTLMAQGVIAGASVPCEFEIPEAPMGQTLDLDTVQVKYSSGGVEIDTFDQVPSLADCNDTSFYIEDNMIKLCPGACAIVQADENAEIDILFGCELGDPT